MGGTPSPLSHFHTLNPIPDIPQFQKGRSEMNPKEHAGIGLLAFLGYSYVLLSVADPAIISWFGLFAVIIGSLIPDFFEPATSSKHRSSFHSIGTLIGAILLFGLTGIIAVVISFFSSFSIKYMMCASVASALK